MTSSPSLPSWLSDATAAHLSATNADVNAVDTADPVQASGDTYALANEPAKGQIRRLEPMDADGTAARLVLVVNADSSSAAVQVVLLTNESEMGSDRDTRLTPDLTGLPYDVLALFDVTAPAWYVQLGPVLATIDLDEIEFLPPAGTPVAGPEDARWNWKQDEHDSLVRLSGECARQIVDEGVDNFVDPAALDLEAVSDVELALIVRATAPLMDRGRLCMPLEALRKLDAHRVDPQSRYWESVRCLLELVPRHDDLVIAEPLDRLPIAPRAHINNDQLVVALSAVMEKMPNTYRSLGLFTLGSLWQGETLNAWETSAQPTLHLKRATSGVWEMFVSGRRHQLVVHAVDETDAQTTTASGHLKTRRPAHA